MADCSGGRKLIVTGVCHHRTIGVLYSTRTFNNENVNNCFAGENPLHEEQIAVVKIVGDTLPFDTVIDHTFHTPRAIHKGINFSST
ncbi:MAG TPA: hypothetical protein PLX88_08620, partial [Syntrophorhabdaceae bacterium]|nr:hypothetical protein [Syntrophorhabdaceae bacterium]